MLTGTVSHEYDNHFIDKTDTGTEWITAHWDNGGNTWVHSDLLAPCYGPMT